MGGPVPGSVGQQSDAHIPPAPAGVPATGGALALTLPEIGPAEQYLVDLYDRTYGKLPGKCAQRLAWAVREAEGASAAGDGRRAAEALRQAACYQAVLDKHQRCRRCGRELRHPASVARGIGPECWEKKQ